MTSCPHCGGAPASVTPAADGTTWAVCGACGMSFQVAGRAPGSAPAPRPTPRSAGRGWLGCLMAGPGSLGLFIPLVFLFCPKACASIDGGHQAALAGLAACPRATELLGEDVDAAWVGTNFGESESGTSTGHAEWELTVSGSRGRGDYSFQAQMGGGEWRLVRGTLRAAGQTVDVPWGCGAASAAVPTVPAAPTAPGAPAPPVGSACDRMQRCCDVAGTSDLLRGLCQSHATIRGAPNAEMTCGQLYDSAGRLLAIRGPVPPACQ